MDPLADMLTKIRNASRAGLPATSFGFSNIKLAVSEALKKAGYLKSVTKKGKKVKKTIEVELVYTDKEPKFENLERVSKPSHRVYVPAKEVHFIRQGHGTAFYSTSSGIMTDREARVAKVGGEYLFKVY